jgi:hypothetical protein
MGVSATSGAARDAAPQVAETPNKKTANKKTIVRGKDRAGSSTLPLLREAALRGEKRALSRLTPCFFDIEHHP